MKIDKAGFPFIATAALPAILSVLAKKQRLAIGFAALTAGVTAFFRDPERYPDLPVDIDPDIVVASADGKVMHAGTPEPGVAPDGDWQQISIFLSLANVHINRTPYGGRVTDITYHPGKYLAAFTKESAVANERTDITVSSEHHGVERVVIYRQIVGLLARRIVTRINVGDQSKTGQRIGLMKFGSRMDIFLPSSVPLLVGKGDRVVAGESTLARWPVDSADSVLGFDEGAKIEL